jgi:regulator of protease activity HflC (stomatin/prohibitin superfamily)
MSMNEPVPAPDTTYAQLIQTTATIADASELFASNDPAAAMPIVIVPRYQNRFFNPLMVTAAVAAIGAAAAGYWLEPRWIALAIAIGAVVLAVLGIRWALVIMIPEGLQALLTHGGKYKRTVGAGYHTLPPWVIVSHLVTARAIPYAVLVRQSPTADLVRADMDGTITFVIEDAARFVFKTSTGAFDEILQATCQDALRATVRRRPAAEINDIGVAERDEMRQRITADVTGFGVTITNVNITRARLPEPFMQSQEARQLAILQQAEQAEQQTLALRRLTDRTVLARQEIVAEVERQRETLRGAVLQAEIRRQVAEMDTETLQHYPEAVRLELQRARLEIGKALAANSRAIVRVAGMSDFEQLIALDDATSMRVAPTTAAPDFLLAER